MKTRQLQLSVCVIISSVNVCGDRKLFPLRGYSFIWKEKHTIAKAKRVIHMSQFNTHANRFIFDSLCARRVINQFFERGPC